MRIRPRTGDVGAYGSRRHQNPVMVTEPALPARTAQMAAHNEYGASPSLQPHTLGSIRAAQQLPGAAVTHNNFFSSNATRNPRPTSPPSASSFHSSVRTSFVHKQRQLHLKRPSTSSALPNQKPAFHTQATQHSVSSSAAARSSSGQQPPATYSMPTT